VRFVVDNVASGQVFFECFGSPANTIHSTNFSIIIIITILKYKRKIEMPPVGEGPHVTPFKAAKGFRAIKLAQRNVDF
jgi:hypothetical protein